MAVTYTKDQRAKAKADGLWLVTIDGGGGVCFQGAVTSADRLEVVQFLERWLSKRYAGRRKSSRPSSSPV